MNKPRVIITYTSSSKNHAQSSLTKHHSQFPSTTPSSPVPLPVLHQHFPVRKFNVLSWTPPWVLVMERPNCRNFSMYILSWRRGCSGWWWWHLRESSWCCCRVGDSRSRRRCCLNDSVGWPVHEWASVPTFILAPCPAPLPPLQCQWLTSTHDITTSGDRWLNVTLVQRNKAMLRNDSVISKGLVL